MSKKKIGIAVAILFILGAFSSMFALVINQCTKNPVQSGGTQCSTNITGDEQITITNASSPVNTKDIVLTLSGAEKVVSNGLDKLQYSFFRNELIHPKIIEDMLGWMSDTGDQVVSVNLIDANHCNRYSGKVQVQNNDGEKYPYVFYEENKESEGYQYTISFGYQYIGTSDSGIHVLYTSSSGGGSGIFKSLIFLTLEKDEGIVYDYDKSRISKQARINLKSLGSMSLGDRYFGDLQLKNGLLKIGKDKGRFSETEESKDVFIQLQ